MANKNKPIDKDNYANTSRYFTITRREVGGEYRLHRFKLAQTRSKEYILMPMAVTLHETIDEARCQVPPRSRHVPRQPSDHDYIVETWL